MDQALRRLERGDDPIAYATALRRAGDEVRARRAVEAAVRAGHAGAAAALDAWWPLDERVERVVAVALEDPAHRRWSNVRTALAWLLAEEDPRLEPALARLAAALLEETAVPVDSPGWRDDERLIAAARGPADARRRVVVQRAGADLPGLALARARLDAAEARDVVERAESAGDHMLLACGLWHAGQAGALDLLRRAEAAAPFVASERAAWLPADAPAPALLPGRPFRPAWAPRACPAETRDALTGAFTRASFVADPAAPLVSDAPREAPMGDWILDVDVVELRRLAERHGHPAVDRMLAQLTAALQRCVGDRVARWGGDEWLVRLERDVDARDVAERLRTTVRALDLPVEGGEAVRVTVSIGIGRADTWASAIVRASTAMALASREGGDRVRAAI